jgi:membrane protease YdiL (CAAX protease family)
MMKTAGNRNLRRILIGFVPIWLVLDRSAALFDSTLGEAGILVCTLVVVAVLGVEAVVFKQSLTQALRALGFGWPGMRALLVGLSLSLALLAFYPLFSWLSGVPLGLRESWLWLAPGLFAQAGIAEETLFRGYLFRHLRAHRAFWPAAFLAMLPFTVVHLLLFFSVNAPLALASIFLAILVSFPMAHLFELGRNTIWLSALMHFIVQGSIKLVEIPEPVLVPAAIAWMAVSALLPYAAFAIRPQREVLTMPQAQSRIDEQD